ncbi:MAG: hypothetical protein JWR07_5451 [Nevskia sp.]|nr:hypothetical protein [Nevskia sp.]
MSDITEVDCLNAKIADLKKTVEWLQGRIGITMGATVRAEIADPTAPQQVQERVATLASVPQLAAPSEARYHFRKKPVVIEAFQFAQRNNGPIPYPDWFDDALTRNDIITHGTGKWSDPTEPCYCEIKTLEGVMRAEPGDWIIRGLKGELYPCKADIFVMSYESAATPVPLPVEPQLIYPPTMTPLLAHVMGFPNFHTGPIAHVFQKAGFDIPTKCEAEQAFVLDRMIRAVLTHGEGWAAAFEDDLRAQYAIIEERKVAATPSEQPKDEPK